MPLARNVLTSCLMTIVTTLLFGIAYPLAITGLAQLLFPEQANGQLLRRGDAVVGSRLIGQQFATPGYFRSRPSAAGEGYDAANSAGSQLGPTNRTLIDGVRERVRIARLENPSSPVPIDLVTASASGIDPHLSPDAASFQIPRVAHERGGTEADLSRLVGRHTEGRQFGLLGEPRVNVLELNLALDREYPRTGAKR